MDRGSQRVQMADEVQAGASPAQSDLSKEEEAAPKPGGIKWTRYLGLKGKDSQALEERWAHREKWSMGILSDKHTDEVPGTILLLAAKRNEPLGLRNTPARTSATSLPSPYPPSRGSSRGPAPPKKRTADGAIVLDPQPEESMNDPLNWPVWRRDLAMLCLGFYCMLGGGMTPILAAAYNEVSAEYSISFHKVALTTGLYMLGLGLGSVVMSPTAILYGKRPVYIAGATMFIISAVWCAVSPSYVSLVIARIFQGLAVSPVECLPSATIAEIYFLHERAYRVGVYTLLLLGGKNLIPLVSAAITNSLGWRWIFWMVAITTGFSAILVFLFVPETFWDRTPRPRAKRPHMRRSMSDIVHTLRGRSSQPVTPGAVTPSALTPGIEEVDRQLGAITPRKHKNAHVGFAEDEKAEIEKDTPEVMAEKDIAQSPIPAIVVDPEAQRSIPASRDQADPTIQLSQQQIYTSNLRAKPQVSFIQSLKPWNGRIAKDNWFRVMARPLILFAYPAVLWSSMVYALSVGWLIVLSESVAEIYAKRDTYNFTPLQVGLVYISPFVAGILGTIVAGRVSDVIVRFMSRRNGGVYEPEFRLVMGLPSTLATTIGLMGFGWSAQEKDNWIVPTVFFGILSFGCTLGSTTSITYCVDSYRQYAGEALVTLNFSKNVLHGFVFSLFFVQWLQADGAKDVFVALGGIHLALMLFTIPLYIYGKRARMWTVRKHLMEKF